jgi:FAD/FMN-containing dehydrogenase
VATNLTTGLTVTNWFGDLVSHPAVIVDAHSAADIVRVLKDPVAYPSPVRAVGSNHSTAPCGVAEGGTLIRMKMNRILAIGPDAVTVEAGALYRDIALQLLERNLQFHVNTEIGSLSAGSAACAGTKDASMPGEYGQVGSYVIGVKMVLPSGDLAEFTEAADPEVMKQIRCCYGTFGIVYEVTFRVRPLVPMAVHHKTFSLAEFVAALPELKALDYSMFFYMFLFTDRITVEFRKYNPGATGAPDRTAWKIRNYFWGTAGPRFAADVEHRVADPQLRYSIIESFNAMWRFKLENIIVNDHTLMPDQMIQYPPVADDSRYTFSLFAFPEEQYPETLLAYTEWVNDYHARMHYRTDLIHVGYRIAADQQALLSYSYDGTVMTIDPVSTGNPGWKPFLTDYNAWCSSRGGVPLLNQTFGVTHEIARRAFGDRLAVIADARKTYDPSGRLLNDYFRAVFGA